MKLRRIQIFILLTLALMLYGCQPSGANTVGPQPGEDFIPVTGQNFEGAIISKEQASDTELAEDYWTPSEEQILQMENALPSFLEQAGQSGIANRLPDYKRQYIGLISEGRKIIYGNYFCNDNGINWKKEALFVLDGGDCYFQAQYDLESGTFITLQVNGEA